jgi:Ca2+-binding EF-hand superfamily protein
MRDDTRNYLLRSRAVVLTLSVVSMAAVVAAARVTPRQDQGSGRPGGRGPGGLSGMAVFMALDTDGTPGLSAAEVASATAVLTALDKNGDGSLSPDELPAFGRGDGPQGRRGRGGRDGGLGETAPTSADDLAATLMAFDRNDDGTLTQAEVPERFQGLFDRADANKDGVLTLDELKQSAAAQPAPSQARGRDEGDGGRGGRGARRGGPFGGPDPLIVALDLNGDGRLSAAELATVPTALTGFDRNGDGVVALDEIFVGFGRGRGRG